MNFEFGNRAELAAVSPGTHDEAASAVAPPRNDRRENFVVELCMVPLTCAVWQETYVATVAASGACIITNRPGKRKRAQIGGQRVRSGLVCPGGPTDNSPAIDRWVRDSHHEVQSRRDAR